MEDTMEADRRAAIDSVFKERDRLIAENERLREALTKIVESDSSTEGGDCYCCQKGPVQLPHHDAECPIEISKAALAGKGQGK